MKRKEKIYLTIFLSIFVFVVWLSANVEEDPWRLSFGREDARAYGSQVLYDVLPYLFGNKEITAIDIPPYEVVSDTSIKSTNYIFITEEFAPDPAEALALKKHVARGNTVFVAASGYKGTFLSGLRMVNRVRPVSDQADFDDVLGMIDTTRINFANPQIAAATGFFYSTDLLHSYLEIKQDTTSTDDEVSLIEDAEDELSDPSENLASTDSLQHVVLGGYEEGGHNFIRVGYGNGFFLLSSVPLAFTNYNMLEEGNAAYTYAALSYLPAQPTFWDLYYKPNKLIAQTPLRYVLSAPAFRAGYYIALGSMLLFIFIHVRRKQRIIPVIPPKENKTVEFAHTVGRLYFNEGDHSNLALKQVDQFRHYVHNKLRLPATDLASVEAERIGARTGVDITLVNKLLALLVEVEKGKKIDARYLINLSGQLDVFYTISKR